MLDPLGLLELAHRSGVSVLGITDHDTAAGVRALTAARAEGLDATSGAVEVVAGIEVSSGIGRSELHVLGYFIDPAHERLLAFEAERRASRHNRIARMVERLNAEGLPITMDEVHGEVGGDGAPGRPHLARALIKRGHAASVRDCFDRLLLEGGPGYVPYEKPSPANTCELIRAIGGVPIVAHPGLDGVHQHLDALIEAGAAGLEVWHSAHSEAESERFLAFCEARGVLATGGSDFHGVGQKEGGGVGSVHCPPERFERLKARAQAS
ncbi:MAG: PHP domain-containing protein [Planctomycetota bacterium]